MLEKQGSSCPKGLACRSPSLTTDRESGLPGRAECVTNVRSIPQRHSFQLQGYICSYDFKRGRQDATAKILLCSRLHVHHRTHQEGAGGFPGELLQAVPMLSSLPMPCARYLHHKEGDQGQVCLLVFSNRIEGSRLLCQRVLQAFFNGFPIKVLP